MCVCIPCISIALHLRACVIDARVCVCRQRACAPRRCVGPLVARRRPAVFIYGAARGADGVCICLRLCHRPVSRALLAGVTWTNRTLAAQWAVRSGHTSVVDAAGAIYVIGGYGGSDNGTDVSYKDV